MLQFTVDKERNPNSPALRRLLEAHVVYERMSSAKKFSLHLLTIVGLVIWIGAEWPAFLPPRVFDCALALWIGLLFLALLASVEQWFWHRKVDRYRREQRATTPVDGE
jgi:hypothetical protein